MCAPNGMRAASPAGPIRSIAEGIQSRYTDANGIVPGVSRLLIFPLFAPVLLAGCTTAQEPWPDDAPPFAAEGTLVPLGQSVIVGRMLVTPLQVVEDSRCPANARCVWAGEFKLRARVETAGIRETTILELGRATSLGDHMVSLVEVEPQQTAGTGDIPLENYRFGFETRDGADD